MAVDNIPDRMAVRENSPGSAMQDFLLTKRGTTWTVTRMHSRFNPSIRAEEVVCYLYKRRFDRKREALEFAGVKASAFAAKDPTVTPRFFTVKEIEAPLTHTEGN
jgi:hypothetical protein